MEYEDFSDPALGEFVEETMKEFKTPGMAVLVTHGNRTWAKGYGYSDIADKVPVTPSTLFFAGSTTKSFTASMAAHLVEDEQFPEVSWKTPLAKLIRDDFVLDQGSPNGQWATNHITLEDALSMRTGMPRHDLTWINGDPSNRDLVRQMRHLPLHNELREKFEYCNLMYTAVSYATETTIGRPFKELLKQHIFHPLGMNETTYTLSDAMEIAEKHEEAKVARGYLWDSDVKEYEVVPFESIAPAKGSGGIISNVLDYKHWVKHLMKPSGLPMALREKSAMAIRTPKMLTDPDPRRPQTGPRAYCMGLYSQVYRGREILWHSGATAGYMALMLMVPPTPTELKEGEEDCGWAVVIMQNTYSLAQDVVAWYLLDKFLQTPENERHDMAQAARDTEARATESMATDKVLERLFGEKSIETGLNPTLPLQHYEGIYQHPAYHEFRISAATSESKEGSVSQTQQQEHNSEEKSKGAAPGLQLYLRSGGLQTAYCDVSATLHHVSGDWWWSHQRLGPSSWLTDHALKVQFVIDAKGGVQGMRYQAEVAMPEHLAFFKKIE
ncbi:beta-lactamase/transpeptidase-like protein [Rhizodiscina lignyota]|uniref:Beta-lactamase/transpeptidase-like protein n=1 Tax=Rhizodiscina lignyota TaxID=1504668 RepID=A0A9P4IM47_9PEZI|nr:beta-lactamase/transpeptidase-like protein [Rhizodiscina lignyota]